jgi:hypothetical protein
MNHSLDWWDSVHLMFLAMASEMSARQQQKIVENLRGLARLREQSGDTVAASFMYALANGGNAEGPPRARPSGHLRLVQ